MKKIELQFLDEGIKLEAKKVSGEDLLNAAALMVLTAAKGNDGKVDRDLIDPALESVVIKASSVIQHTIDEE